MNIAPYLTFNGNAENAIHFYEEIFNATDIVIEKFKDIPKEHSVDKENKNDDLILYAQLRIDGNLILLSDSCNHEASHGGHISVNINHDNIDEIRSYFNKLKVGGEITMELMETFWSKCYGSLTDKFGISWIFNYNGK